MYVEWWPIFVFMGIHCWAGAFLVNLYFIDEWRLLTCKQVPSLLQLHTSNVIKAFPGFQKTHTSAPTNTPRVFRGICIYISTVHPVGDPVYATQHPARCLHGECGERAISVAWGSQSSVSSTQDWAHFDSLIFCLWFVHGQSLCISQFLVGNWNIDTQTPGRQRIQHNGRASYCLKIKMKKIITSKKLFFLLIIISKVRSKLERDKNQMEMVHLACVHNAEFWVGSSAIVIVFSK